MPIPILFSLTPLFALSIKAQGICGDGIVNSGPPQNETCNDGVNTGAFGSCPSNCWWGGGGAEATLESPSPGEEWPKWKRNLAQTGAALDLVGGIDQNNVCVRWEVAVGGGGFGASARREEENAAVLKSVFWTD